MTDKMSPYATSKGMWSAAKAKAQARSQETGLDANRILDEFVMQRLLARVALHDSQGWVLKGGSAMLMRVPNVRATRDIDLFAREVTIEHALEKLDEALAVNLNDFFRFRVEKTQTLNRANAQGLVRGCQVSVGATLGVKHLSRIRIDLVTGSLMTGEPDMAKQLSLIQGFTGPTIMLYPIVDHIADKVCATQDSYANGRSQRARDLVDLVVFRSTQKVDGAALELAIHSEWQHRGLNGLPTFNPPKGWKSGYTKLVGDASANLRFPAFEQAVLEAREFILPAANRQTAGRSWDPNLKAWR